MTLWIEQRGLCWICGEPMLRFGNPHKKKSVSRDHLQPRKFGGRNNVANYLLAHRKCNSDRAAPENILTPEAVRAIKEEAFKRLRQSPHWVENYVDPHNGAYRGKEPKIGTLTWPSRC